MLLGRDGPDALPAELVQVLIVGAEPSSGEDQRRLAGLVDLMSFGDPHQADEALSGQYLYSQVFEWIRSLLWVA